jgi:hypothetical protein
VEQRIKDLYIVNTVAGRAQNNLRVLAEMAADHKLPEWYLKEVKRIGSGIETVASREAARRPNILHADAQGRQDFARAAHWRRGFLLAPEGGGLARIEYNGSDRRDAARCVGFDLQVAAHQPREVWAVFVRGLDFLLRDLERHYGYTSIEVRRLVSCPADRCPREAGQRFYIEEGNIAARAQQNRDGWRDQIAICNARGCNQNLPVGLLWDGRATTIRGSSRASKPSWTAWRKAWIGRPVRWKTCARTWRTCCTG